MVRRKLMGRLAPYLLVLPGWLWLVIFFVIPVIAMLSLSTQTGDLIDGFTQTFHWQNYLDGWNEYHVEFIRSVIYGAIATILCIVIGYPVAYWIAFRGGHRKSSLLFLLLLPFFVSFVIRVVSWQFMLADNGIILEPLKAIHLLPADFHILATATAVVGGLTYNFVPFMILPIYVALERIHPEVMEAAGDLYATRRAAFRRVVLPLSMPGVFAGVLLTFVPAAADYVNASILGGTDQTMIGNVIETEYFTNTNYPMASALSFILMAALLIGVFIYAKVLGTREVLDMAVA